MCSQRIVPGTSGYRSEIAYYMALPHLQISTSPYFYPFRAIDLHSNSESFRTLMVIGHAMKEVSPGS